MNTARLMWFSALIIFLGLDFALFFVDDSHAQQVKTNAGHLPPPPPPPKKILLNPFKNYVLNSQEFLIQLCP